MPPGRNPIASPSVTTAAAEQVVNLYGLGGGATLCNEGGLLDSDGLRGHEPGNPGTQNPAQSATASASGVGWVAQTIALVPAGSGCANACWYGIQAMTNSGTSYAGAISAAETALETTGRPDAQKVIIFLSDGAANIGTRRPAASPRP